MNSSLTIVVIHESPRHRQRCPWSMGLSPSAIVPNFDPFNAVLYGPSGQATGIRDNG